MSQSLLFQVYLLTRCVCQKQKFTSSRNPFYFRSIFLHKGVVHKRKRKGRRNPFYFRSIFLHGRGCGRRVPSRSQSLLFQVYLLTLRKKEESETGRGRNPFYFRSIFLRRVGDRKEIIMKSRNPFYFRSIFLLLTGWGSYHWSPRRNPFYFRSIFLPRKRGILLLGIQSSQSLLFQVYLLTQENKKENRRYFTSQSLLFQVYLLTLYYGL